MAEQNEIKLDEYVRQVIKRCETHEGNERFILVYGLLQELFEKAEIKAIQKTKIEIIKIINKSHL